ncbi:MAG: hypothetical protein EAX96_12345 [Candidatus Lokiarchaeota archaeon]|nr:hypothetical protein [Candidatus Lokiarchaeota archaeon]
MSTVELLGIVTLWMVFIQFLLGILTLNILIKYMNFADYKITLTLETKRKLSVWNTTFISLESAIIPFIVILSIMIPISLFFESLNFGYFSIFFFFIPVFIILGQFKIIWSYYRDFGKIRAFLSFVVWWGPSFLISVLVLFLTNTFFI